MALQAYENAKHTSALLTVMQQKELEKANFNCKQIAAENTGIQYISQYELQQVLQKTSLLLYLPSGHCLNTLESIGYSTELKENIHSSTNAKPVQLKKSQ